MYNIINERTFISLNRRRCLHDKSSHCSGARTPFGKFGGALRSLKAAQLGGAAIRAAIEKAGLDKATIDEVIIGNVLQGGQGQIPSRQAAREAGIPWEVKTETI